MWSTPWTDCIIEQLTDKMEAKILEVIAIVDAAGLMLNAVEGGLMQRMIGESFGLHQEKIIGVNSCYDDEASHVAAFSRLDPKWIDEQLATLKRFKSERSQSAVQKALDGLSNAAENRNINIMKKTVEASDANVTHREIRMHLRDILGYGYPLIAA